MALSIITSEYNLKFSIMCVMLCHFYVSVYDVYAAIK